MSWKHERYKITCRNCGNVGALKLYSYNWDDIHHVWDGFTGRRTRHFTPTLSTANCDECESSDIKIEFERANWDLPYSA
jgi:Zn finger protein HypA/HybF involved in hydrogenase expression